MVSGSSGFVPTLILSPSEAASGHAQLLQGSKPPLEMSLALLTSEEFRLTRSIGLGVHRCWNLHGPQMLESVPNPCGLT